MTSQQPSQQSSSLPTRLEFSASEGRLVEAKPFDFAEDQKQHAQSKIADVMETRQHFMTRIPPLPSLPSSPPAYSAQHGPMMAMTTQPSSNEMIFIGGSSGGLQQPLPLSMMTMNPSVMGMMIPQQQTQIPMMTMMNNSTNNNNNNNNNNTSMMMMMPSNGMTNGGVVVSATTSQQPPSLSTSIPPSSSTIPNYTTSSSYPSSSPESMDYNTFLQWFVPTFYRHHLSNMPQGKKRYHILSLVLEYFPPVQQTSKEVEEQRQLLRKQQMELFAYLNSTHQLP